MQTIIKASSGRLTGIGLLLFFAVCGLSTTARAETPSLSSDLCIICHENAPADIAEAGMAHRDDISCLECHDGHPPKQLEVIPQCANCHEGTAHFDLKDCLSCHQNPHRPLEIQFGKDVTTPCLTCHEEQGAQLKEVQTRHSALACSACHNQHGLIPQCTQCHEVHAPTMTAGDCTGCHRAHQPAPVVYGASVPSEQCAACHDDVLEQLKNNPAKHRELLCATCHKDQHKNIPQCAECHGSAHWKTLADKYPNCLECHENPHDLPH